MLEWDICSARTVLALSPATQRSPFIRPPAFHARTALRGISFSLPPSSLTLDAVITQAR